MLDCISVLLQNELRVCAICDELMTTTAGMAIMTMTLWKTKLRFSFTTIWEFSKKLNEFFLFRCVFYLSKDFATVLGSKLIISRRRCLRAFSFSREMVSLVSTRTIEAISLSMEILAIQSTSTGYSHLKDLSTQYEPIHVIFYLGRLHEEYESSSTRAMPNWTSPDGLNSPMKPLHNLTSDGWALFRDWSRFAQRSRWGLLICFRVISGDRLSDRKKQNRD